MKFKWKYAKLFKQNKKGENIKYSHVKAILIKALQRRLRLGYSCNSIYNLNTRI